MGAEIMLFRRGTAHYLQRLLYMQRARLVSACYKVVQDLLAKSKEQNGSIICAEILGLKGHEKVQSSYVASARTAEYYKSRPCAAKVESAARIFAEYLMEKEKA